MYTTPVIIPVTPRSPPAPRCGCPICCSINASGTFELVGVKGTIKQARFLVGTGGPLSVTQTNNTVKIALPAHPPQPSLAMLLVLDQVL